MFHQITKVCPIDDMQLIVHFKDNSRKSYDVKPLVRRIPSFEALIVPALFRQVRVDAGGYGISWNDELDISCNELWENGQQLP